MRSPGRKVSVVIPTRERHDTLFHCLRTVVDQDVDDLEIIVSDNASSSDTRDVVESFRSPRIRYVNTGKRVSMTHNFEFGLSHASGDWVAFLGDDDGFLPGGIRRAVDTVTDSGQLALGSQSCVYNWPSVYDPATPVLEVPLRRGSRLRNSRQVMGDVLVNRTDYRQMPLLYTGGVIHRSVIEKISADQGAVFRSQIPDVYSGFAICGVVPEYLFMDEPFALGGRSSHSNGLETLLRFSGGLAQFHAEGLIPFHPDIPLPSVGTFTFSLPALQYESYLQSAFLHHNELSVQPLDQAAWILGMAPSECRDMMLAWARGFAAHHKLEFDAILVREKEIAPASFQNRIARGLRYALNNYKLYRPVGAGPEDVFAASEAANVILREQPSPLPGQAKLAFGLSQKILRRLLSGEDKKP